MQTLATIGALTSAILLLLVFTILVTQLGEPHFPPRCQEDQVIVGFGDFQDGTWTSYGCGPALDDIVIVP